MTKALIFLLFASASSFQIRHGYIHTTVRRHHLNSLNMVNNKQCSEQCNCENLFAGIRIQIL